MHLQYIDLSLHRIRDFLHKIGNPQDNIPNIIHVAGTNGKGSTVAFVRAILENSGYSVNVFTSPHLVDYKERFRILGSLITQQQLDSIIDRLKVVEGYSNLSFFEATMVIGFVAFTDNKADYCILETGLGGRLDATNVIINPLVSIITTIGYDHQSFLGNTLDKIAYEKAGIIKQNTLVVSDYQVPEVTRVFINIAKKKQANLILGGIHYEKTDNILSYNNHHISFAQLPLLGTHQINNAALAVVACLNILPDLDITTIPYLLSKATWSGRLQQVQQLYGIIFADNEQVFLDGAHNQSGAMALGSFIKEKTKENNRLSIHVIVGMLKKKDIDRFFQVLSVYQDNLVVYPVEVSEHECFSRQEILAFASEYSLKGKMFNSVEETLQDIKNYNQDKLIVICGSLYLLGAVMKENSIIIC